ncbi:MAG: aminoglycoside phosphotransferase family protein [Rhodospirillales bacterium]
MAERDGQILAFLVEHGWAEADRAPLSGDASFRRYERLELDGRRAVLMDAPPADEDVRPFVAVARHLVSLGFSAPRVLAESPDDGFLLLEDLGDETYTKALDDDARDGDADAERALYALAVDVLVDLHRRPAAEVVPKGLPPYGNGRLLDEAFLLPRWYLPAMTGEPVPEPQRKAYGEAWLQVFPHVHAQPRTLVLRDYHVDNLMLLKGRDGVARCGLLDFQDAVAGPGAYDLMSLLEDARRDIDPGLRDAMVARYVDAFPGLDRDAFVQAFRILAAQRHAKVIGIFTRLSVRDGKPRYLEHIPRVWRLLEAALDDPALAPVAAWFDAHVPPDRRGAPPSPAAVA